MRKKRLKELYPNRHRTIHLLREQRDDWPKEFLDSEGNSVYLNLRKHFYYGRPYLNPEHQMELSRNSGRFINEQDY